MSDPEQKPGHSALIKKILAASENADEKEITRLRAEVAELRSQRDRARLALDVALAAGAECEGHIAELRAENAAKDARIAELEAALYCENSPYEAKTHRCVHCDEEVLR